MYFISTLQAMSFHFSFGDVYVCPHLSVDGLFGSPLAHEV